PDGRYLRLHTGHLMFVRPEEERFLSEELIRLSTFTAGRDELVDRVRMLRDAGYQQLAVQLVPGHADAMAAWMEAFSRVCGKRTPRGFPLPTSVARLDEAMGGQAVPDFAARPPSRVVIEDVTPRVDGGRFAAKRTVGEPVEVGATIFAEGHELLAA